MAVFPRGGVKKFKGVGCMQPEMICIASFKGTSSVFVWVLGHLTGAQYSAGANTSAVVEVYEVSNDVSQLVPNSFSPVPLGKTPFVSVYASGFCMLDSDPG